MWTIAYALQIAAGKLASSEAMSWKLEDFNYRVPFWSDLFREALNSVSFVGVTVSVASGGCCETSISLVARKKQIIS